ncbi:MAG: hypothetical protein NTW21_27885 [Verrucomicrobia bacterium]|nr:hypothetical protein [Verrucomicrobiota bacterium]
MKNTIHPNLTNPMIQARTILTSSAAAALLWLTCVSAPALNLPQIFSDNMVLQQGLPVPVWGGADKGEDVTVTLAGQSATTKTGDDGRWKVVLKELKPADDPLDMAVTGSSGKSITLKNILVGEVWVCSGQSYRYNGMIAPLIPYAIRGAIWYQGEADVPRAYQYRTLLPAMIANWRADWGQGDFPFGIVQLAPYRYGDQNPVNCAELWEAQSLTVKNVPNTGLAGTMDIGNLKDIHPLNKQYVGKRLALWALAKAYGKTLVYSGPIYKSMTVETNKIRLQFDHPGGGLTASNGKPLVEFTIAGADQKFVPATAAIDGASVVVQCDQVAQPMAVRYAWHDDAQPNLTNKEGLPASPFRTDTWKGATEK